MKKILLLAIPAVALLFASCDKVENAYPAGVSGGGLDWSLYPDGDSATYVSNGLWPAFVQNTNANRNILIEDFTGHKCVFCPAAAAEAENLADANPDRVFVAGLHTGPQGPDNNHEIDPPTYGTDFTNDAATAIGIYFGNDWPGTAFQGNPSGTINRTNSTTGQPVTTPAQWSNEVAAQISANDLKVNIQAEVNYFASTRGLFVHTEIEKVDSQLDNELRTVVYLIEDSLQSPQKYPGNADSLNYVHKHIMRGTIDGFTFGQELDDDHELNDDDKYYFNYSFELPSQYDPSNMHVIIFVRDAVTEEIYHVIEESLE